jgi:hypothetical protein
MCFCFTAEGLMVSACLRYEGNEMPCRLLEDHLVLLLGDVKGLLELVDRNGPLGVGQEEVIELSDSRPIKGFQIQVFR